MSYGKMDNQVLTIGQVHMLPLLLNNKNISQNGMPSPLSNSNIPLAKFSKIYLLRPNPEFVPIWIGISVWMSKCHPVPVWDGKITIVFTHYVHRVTAVGWSCMTVRCWIVTTVRCWIVTLVLEWQSRSCGGAFSARLLFKQVVE
jgi:hypothetical protein